MTIVIHVNRERCQQYGQCVLEAPDHFQLDDQGRLEHRASADVSQLPEIEAAADICPTQAISIVQPQKDIQR